MRNATLRLLLVGILGFSALGCEDPQVVELCRAASLCETPHDPPNDYIVLCDATPGATCDRSRLSDAIDSVLVAAIHRPGSVVEVWAVGTDAHDARVAATASVPTPPARTRSISSWQEEPTASLPGVPPGAFRPYVPQGATQQRSAIAEALTRIGQSRLGRTGTPAHLLVISDLREHVPGLTLECPRRLPLSPVLRGLFARRGVLGPDALSAFTEVQVLGHALPPFPQRRGPCDVSIRREADLAALWSEALLAAGARVVVFRGRTASFEANASDDP